MKKILQIIFVLILGVVVINQALKLENYLDADKNQVDEKAKTSLIQRQPKFLFRTTSTTTSVTTLSTVFSCFTYAAADIKSVCDARRKRQMNFNWITSRAEKGESSSNIIQPTPTRSDKAMKYLSNEIESSSINDDDGGKLAVIERKPRFFFFFTTTYSTVTSTATSFTSTYTFSLSLCLPQSFAYSVCG